MRTPVLVFMGLVGIGSALKAQTQQSPTLMFTIYGGTSTGHQLWQIDKQPMPQRGTASPDTAFLSRRLSSGITAGLLTGYFPNSYLGLNVDVGFRTFDLDDTCTPVAPFQPEVPPRNQVLCDNITASGNGGSVLTFSLGATGRVAPHGAISPYVRVAGSISHMRISTIEVVEAEPIDTVGNQLRRGFILDPTPRQTSLGLTFGGGITFQVSSAYHVRLEVRDDIATHERITGPASPLAIAPTQVSSFHRVAVLLGIDVILEQKRTRRY